MATRDPLLQPFRLKHLTLKNRIMSTAHEPAYAEDGLPKDRYRLYHREKAKGGIALTMTAGSAVVAEDSPPAFGNLHAYRDEIVPWLRRLADDCHAHGCAVSANTFTIVKQNALRIGPSSSRITVTGNTFSDSSIGGGAVKRETDDLAASGLTLEGTSDVAVIGNLFSGVAPKALARVTFRVIPNTASAQSVDVEDASLVLQ